MVTSLVVFSFFIKPEKYNQCDETAKIFNPASFHNTQILNRFSFGSIEYSSTFAEMHKKPIQQDANYIRVIKEQTGLVENKTEEKINVLFFLVRNNKKYLREFGDYLASLWEENGIPYKLKSGQYRLQFRNIIGIRPAVLKSIGFVLADKKSKLWVYTGGEKMKEDNWDDMDEMEVEEIETENDEIDEEDEAPKKKSKKSKKNKKADKKAESKKDGKKKAKKNKKREVEEDDVEDESLDDFGDEAEDEEEESPKEKSSKKRTKKDKDSKKKDGKADKKPAKKDKDSKKEKKEDKGGSSLKDKLAEVAQNLSKYMRSEVKDGVMLLTKADLSKSLKEEISDKHLKQIADALSEKYNVKFDKSEGELQVWKKAKKAPASLLKVK